jgi:hypothetical protein
MRRIVVRAPACSADSIIYLKRVFRIHAEELQPGEQVEFAFDAERFPFAAAIFESLMAGAGLKVVGAREEDGTRIFAAEKE